MTYSSEIDLISQVPEASWKEELHKTSYRYHKVGALAAIIFDPVFALTDYYNIPDHWQMLFGIRLIISIITLCVLLFQVRLQLPAVSLVAVPFLLISLQNAFTYKFVGPEDLLGHNLNYIALLIGAGMFVAWHWRFSAFMLLLSAMATAFFVTSNSAISLQDFFIKGGVLLGSTGIFMFLLIKTRYDLSAKEIKARLALQLSFEEIQKRNVEIKMQNEEIHAQAEEIKGINENLETLVKDRTLQLERKNKALEDYAFINAHKLRSPVASILGLSNLAIKIKLSEEDKAIIDHLQRSTEELDAIVSSITKTIERAG